MKFTAKDFPGLCSCHEEHDEATCESRSAAMMANDRVRYEERKLVPRLHWHKWTKWRPGEELSTQFRCCYICEKLDKDYI